MMTQLYEQTCFRTVAGNEFRPGGLRLTQELAGECCLRPGQRVLELGCGVGSTASFLAREQEVSAVGLDSSEPFVEEARTRDPRVAWVCGDARVIPYPEQYFDAVFCECFLSTLEDPARVLREIRRVLRPSGHLAVSDVYLREPEAWSPSPQHAGAACLRGVAGRETILALFEGAGFTVPVWRDRSDALKTLVASLIFSYGSAAAFYEAAVGRDPGRREALEAARPGYYVSIARPRMIDA